MTYRLTDMERLQRALDKYEAIAATFFDVPKPMAPPPVLPLSEIQTHRAYWAELLGEHNDSNDPIKSWRDDDGWHGEVKSFGFTIRVTCRMKDGDGHMVSLWKTDGDEPQLIIQDELEEEIE